MELEMVLRSLSAVKRRCAANPIISAIEFEEDRSLVCDESGGEDEANIADVLLVQKTSILNYFEVLSDDSCKSDAAGSDEQGVNGGGVEPDI
ncbi:hypothetical protein GN244_ATG09043 [Phytophthora infestans]|uniref:Uncharacterized protein n=1 Tax=Phytophthora infestans TaxID=4787 RepID=A0A833WK33_PHYIN|nr:hypothetical protein GN244_ATG09043 [Phytophthora infestans]